MTPILTSEWLYFEMILEEKYFSLSRLQPKLLQLLFNPTMLFGRCRRLSGYSENIILWKKIILIKNYTPLDISRTIN